MKVLMRHMWTNALDRDYNMSQAGLQNRIVEERKKLITGWRMGLEALRHSVNIYGR
jgi:hypothetical protein